MVLAACEAAGPTTISFRPPFHDDERATVRRMLEAVIDGMKPMRSRSAQSAREECKSIERRLEVLQNAVQYAINRLDHDPRGPQQIQLSGDLAVALAYSEGVTT
jgi:hypothetical protein